MSNSRGRPQRGIMRGQDAMFGPLPALGSCQSGCPTPWLRHTAAVTKSRGQHCFASASGGAIELSGGTHSHEHSHNQTIGRWITAYGGTSPRPVVEGPDSRSSISSLALRTFAFNPGSFSGFVLSHGIGY